MIRHINEVEARDALLNEVLEKDAPAKVRFACLEALEIQFRRLTSARERQAFRFVLLQAARRASQLGATFAEQELTDLVVKEEFHSQEDWLFTNYALEIVSPSASFWSVRCSLVDTEITPSVMTILTDIGSVNVGANLEENIGLLSVSHLTKI